MEYMKYKEPESWDVGCKVSWGTYATLAEAREAALVAEHNGRISASLGFDFGYQMPGEIRELENGKYKVTFP